MTTTTTQTAINAARTALYAREAAGEVVSVDEWIALGVAQDALNAPHWSPEGYWR